MRLELFSNYQFEYLVDVIRLEFGKDLLALQQYLNGFIGGLPTIARHVRTVIILKTNRQCLYEHPPSQDDGILTFY